MSIYWETEQPRPEAFVVPDAVVDVAFVIDCRTLPLDHAEALSAALHTALPWLADEAEAGVHLIHGAESGNGWFRPEDPENELLHLSRRARMTLRVPKQRIEETQALTGAHLDIKGHPLTVGRASVRLLSSLPTLFARYVTADRGDVADEPAFLDWVAGELAGLDIPARKVLCGKLHRIRLVDRVMETRSVMVADLDPERSVRLQHHGLGPGRKLGCGLFVAQKGISAVHETEPGR